MRTVFATLVFVTAFGVAAASAQLPDIDPVTGLGQSTVLRLDSVALPNLGPCHTGDLFACSQLSTALHRPYLGGFASAVVARAVAANPDRMVPLPDGSGEVNISFIQEIVDLSPDRTEAGIRAACDAGDCETQARMDAMLCAHGDGLGCVELADLLLQGSYLPRDLGQAAAVLAVGCSVGYGPACDRLDLPHGTDFDSAPDKAAELQGTDNPNVLLAGCMDGLLRACAAGRTGESFFAGEAFPLYSEAVFTMTAFAMFSGAGTGDMVSRQLGLGGWSITDYEAPPTPDPDPDPGPVVRAHLGMNVYWAFGAARSFTLKRQASALRFGGLWHFSALTWGIEGDWMTDNRWRPASKTYRRWMILGKVGADIPLHKALHLRVGGGGQVSTLATSGAEESGSYGTHEFVELAYSLGGFGRETGFLVALRFEQQQNWSPGRDDLDVDHVGGGWLIVGFYTGPKR